MAISCVPDGMATSILAGVSPIHGLYSNFAAPILGGLSASTQRMFVGTTSASALAAGSALVNVPADQRADAVVLLTLMAGGSDDRSRALEARPIHAFCLALGNDRLSDRHRVEHHLWSDSRPDRRFGRGFDVHRQGVLRADASGPDRPAISSGRSRGDHSHRPSGDFEAVDPCRGCSARGAHSGGVAPQRDGRRAGIGHFADSDWPPVAAFAESQSFLDRAGDRRPDRGGHRSDSGRRSG